MEQTIRKNRTWFWSSQKSMSHNDLLKKFDLLGKASDVKEFEETTKNIAVLAEGLAENSGLFFSILY